MRTGILISAGFILGLLVLYLGPIVFDAIALKLGFYHAVTAEELNARYAEVYKRLNGKEDGRDER